MVGFLGWFFFFFFVPFFLSLPRPVDSDIFGLTTADRSNEGSSKTPGPSSPNTFQALPCVARTSSVAGGDRAAPKTG